LPKHKCPLGEDVVTDLLPLHLSERDHCDGDQDNGRDNEPHDVPDVEGPACVLITQHAVDVAANVSHAVQVRDSDALGGTDQEDGPTTSVCVEKLFFWLITNEG